MRPRTMMVGQYQLDDRKRQNGATATPIARTLPDSQNYWLA